ncbi:MAG: hypothetical protein IJ010_06245 [Ruminococcus sp.]|nr:hypothetical protein [Ruminococcus sp.]
MTYRGMCGTHMGTWNGGTAGAFDLLPYAKADCRLVQSECVYARKREQGAASRCHGNVIRGHRWCYKLPAAGLLPTSEWRVQ